MAEQDNTQNSNLQATDLNLVERAEQFKKTLYLNTQDNTNQIDESKYADAIKELKEANKVYSKAIMQPNQITDEDIKVLAKPYPEWEENASYPKGTIINYQGQPYITIQDIPATYTENPTVAMTMYQKYNKDMLYLDAYGNVIKPNNEGTGESNQSQGATGATGKADTSSSTTGATGTTGKANATTSTATDTGTTGTTGATGATGATGKAQTSQPEQPEQEKQPKATAPKASASPDSVATGNTGSTGTTGTTGTTNVSPENLNDASTTVEEPKATPKASPDTNIEDKSKHPKASLDDVIGSGTQKP